MKTLRALAILALPVVGHVRTTDACAAPQEPPPAFKVLVGPHTPIPGGGFFGSPRDPKINDADHVVFRNFAGLYYVDDVQVLKVAEFGDPLARGGSLEVANASYEINKHGQVVFRSNIVNGGAGSGGGGVFVYEYATRSVSEVLRGGDAVEGLGELYNVFAADINDAGVVVTLVSAQQGQRTGVVASSRVGGVWNHRTLIANGDPALDTTGHWTNLRTYNLAPTIHPSVAINNAGLVAAPAGVQGDYRDDDNNVLTNVHDLCVVVVPLSGGPGSPASWARRSTTAISRRPSSVPSSS